MRTQDISVEVSEYKLTYGDLVLGRFEKDSDLGWVFINEMMLSFGLQTSYEIYQTLKELNQRDGFPFRI